MFTLPARKDGFQLILPDDFLVPEVSEKYAPMIIKAKGYIQRPIDFLNETIQKVQVFGFQNAALEQTQPTTGYPLRSPSRIRQNAMQTGGASFQYRNQISPIALTDRTVTVEFRHTLGYMNYVMILENFIYLYTKDTMSNKMFDRLDVNLFNNIGEVYAKIVLEDPVVNSMDMLDFDYSQPIAQSGTFRLEFKYSNFDYQFITDKPIENTEFSAIL